MYYTFRLAHSDDVSFETMKMGLWTWAELTTGILISCLPVMPRFIKHLGSKAYWALSAISKSNRKDGDESTATAIKKETEVLVSFQRPSGRYQGGDSQLKAWADPNSHEIHPKCETVTLCNLNVATPSNVMIVDRNHVLSGYPTREADLKRDHLMV